MVKLHTCVRSNKLSTEYILVSPKSESYLGVGMNYDYDGEDADTLILEHLALQVYT